MGNDDAFGVSALIRSKLINRIRLTHRAWRLGGRSFPFFTSVSHLFFFFFFVFNTEGKAA